MILFKHVIWEIEIWADTVEEAAQSVGADPSDFIAIANK